MALMDCPVCGKRISDKADSCQFCNTPIKGVDQEKLERQQRIRVIKASERLMTLSFIFMLAFVSGFGFMYWWEPAVDSIQMYLAKGGIAIGFVGYIATRIKMLLLKKKK